MKLELAATWLNLKVENWKKVYIYLPAPLNYNVYISKFNRMVEEGLFKLWKK